MIDPARAKATLERLSADRPERSRSTTSAPATRRSPTSSACRSTCIKIDKSFVIDMPHDPSDAAIVRSTIDLAHNLGLQVVAEGVESHEAWRRLEELGCDLAQGFYVSRPLPGRRDDAPARRAARDGGGGGRGCPSPSRSRSGSSRATPRSART